MFTLLWSDHNLQASSAPPGYSNDTWSFKFVIFSLCFPRELQPCCLICFGFKLRSEVPCEGQADDSGSSTWPREKMGLKCIMVHAEANTGPSLALAEAWEPAQANSLLAVNVHHHHFLLTVSVSWHKQLHSLRQLLIIHNLNALTFWK